MPRSAPDAPVYFRITFADGTSVEDWVPANELGRSGNDVLDAEFFFMKRWKHYPPRGVPENSPIVKVKRLPG